MTPRDIDPDLAARSLFDAYNEDPSRTPSWDVQPESVRSLFRCFAAGDRHVHQGTGRVYERNADGAFRRVG